MTVHVCGGYMTVHVLRQHDCTYVSGGYMTVHVWEATSTVHDCMNRSGAVELS